MKMETENDKNRVGIYTQVSAEATAAGEGLAPQGEKSPVATNNGNPNITNQAKYMNMNANQSQCSDSVTRNQATKSQDNTDDDQSLNTQDKPDDWDGGEERINRDSRYRLNRIVSMRKELKLLNFSNSELKAMEKALETERKKRHNVNKMVRYCEENGLDMEIAKQRMLERKESEIAKYKAEKAAREAAKSQNRVLPDFRNYQRDSNRIDNSRGRDRDRSCNKFSDPSSSNDRTGRNRYGNSRDRGRGNHTININSRLNQTRKGDAPIVFVSPAIRAGAPASMKDIVTPNTNEAMQPQTSWQAATLSPNQEFGGERHRSRSPLYRFRKDEEFEEVRRRMGLSGSHDRDTSPSSDSTDLDSTEKSLSAFCNSYNFANMSKKQRKKMRRKKNVEKYVAQQLLNAKYPIQIQIVNRADPFGGISEEYQPLLVNALENSVQHERDNGTDWIKVGACEYKKKILNVHCRNDDTVICLEQKIPLFNSLMPGADLYVAREKVAYSYKKVRVALSNYNLTTEEFFKIIKKQNGYPTETWREYHRRNDNINMVILFGVDPGSYDRLQRDNGMVYFFLGKLALDLDKKPTA